MAKYHLHLKEREINNPIQLEELLNRGRYTVVAMCKNGEPYLVTMSYGYDRTQRILYFHTALKGLKMEFIKENRDVCGTVIEDLGYKEGECAHAYRSLVYRGTLEAVTTLEEKKHGMTVLLKHQEKNPDLARERFIKNETRYDSVNILKLRITGMTGKQGQ